MGSLTGRVLFLLQNRKWHGDTVNEQDGLQSIMRPGKQSHLRHLHWQQTKITYRRWQHSKTLLFSQEPATVSWIIFLLYAPLVLPPPATVSTIAVVWINESCCSHCAQFLRMRDSGNCCHMNRCIVCPGTNAVASGQVFTLAYPCVCCVLAGFRVPCRTNAVEVGFVSNPIAEELFEPLFIDEFYVITLHVCLLRQCGGF